MAVETIKLMAIEVRNDGWKRAARTLALIVGAFTLFIIIRILS